MNQEWICCFNRVEKVIMCVHITQSEITQFVGIVKLILSKNHHFKEKNDLLIFGTQIFNF
jgi:hypothetical protein